MEGIARAREQLRDAALAEPSVFSQALQKLLTTDFDATFHQVKTQKLVLKRRSSEWILDLESEMRLWLPSAPLKGKQKSQVTHHLRVSRVLQQLFEIVDEQSAALRIWQVSTENLVRSLFALVEDRRTAAESLQARQGLQNAQPLSAMKQSEIDRLHLRYLCDYVTRIVNQISAGMPRGVINTEPSSADIQDALKVAELDDMLLHVLDCYTYSNFRVSVGENQLELHGLRSQFEQASEWSSLRMVPRRTLDSYDLAAGVKKTEDLARTLPCEASSFSEFLRSGTGKRILEELQPVRKGEARLLRRDVSDLVDLDLILKTNAGIFRADELLECWALLLQLAMCAHIWCRVFQKDRIARIELIELSSLITTSLGCTAEQGQRLVSQFSLDPFERHHDPFFRPLIKVSAADRLIAGTFIETSRFPRNLFTIAIREGRVDFSAKGLKPLQSLREEFSRAGYRVVLNFPIATPRGTVTDVDIAAAKDGFMFVGQTKVLINPDTPYDSWKVLENLGKAAGQLRRSLPYLSLLEERLGLVKGEYLVVPFLLTNVWNFTGATIDGFKVVDFSYVSMLLRGGEIWAVQFDSVPTREVKKLIRGRYPSGEELSRLLLKPIHEEMFERLEIERHHILIGDWTLTVPLNVTKRP